MGEVMDKVIPVALRDDHLPAAHALSQELRWPYRPEDWQFAHRLGRGFAVEQDGQLLGTALWWPYGDDVASVGMIIVSPAAQRRGIGAALMDALLADTAGRRVVLNSTVEGRRLYERLGFVAYGAVHQHQAVLAVAPDVPATDATIRDLSPADVSELHMLDSEAAGMERRALLDALLPIADTIVAERNGIIVGYACVRTWGRGVVIGPVIAADADVARALIATLAARRVGSFVRIDVTLTSGLSPWLETIGLPKVDAVTAMALGGAPEPRARATLHALSNQSLG